MAFVVTRVGEDEELMQVTGSGKREEAADSKMLRGGIHRPFACEGESGEVKTSDFCLGRMGE